MNCPKCGDQTVVICTRSDCNGVYRYRKCKKCCRTFYTTEVESDSDNFNRLTREIVQKRKL